MRYRVELSTEAQKQLANLPRDVRDRIESEIDEMEERDDSLWSNTKALQGSGWKGFHRKRVGSYRIIFTKVPARGVAEIAAILIKSKDTYR
jgi:mRNA-degrading endonuclease RelE of RelBE toxin-antitoxin system